MIGQPYKAVYVYVTQATSALERLRINAVVAMRPVYATDPVWHVSMFSDEEREGARAARRDRQHCDGVAAR